jgi:hypothetical protein
MELKKVIFEVLMAVKMMLIFCIVTPYGLGHKHKHSG